MNAAPQNLSKASAQAASTSARSLLPQRKYACASSASLHADGAQRSRNPLIVQPRAALQTEPDAVPPIVHEVLGTSGRALDVATRTRMESHFGHDFSRVRIHADARAAESTRAVDALAYTFGRDVVFRDGPPATGTTAGRKLLAHELAHVVQQGGHASSSAAPREVGHANDVAEREADAAAESLVSAGRAPAVRLSTSPRLAFRLLRQPTAAPAGPAQATPDPATQLAQASLAQLQSMATHIHSLAEMTEVDLRLAGSQPDQKKLHAAYTRLSQLRIREFYHTATDIYQNGVARLTQSDPLVAQILKAMIAVLAELRRAADAAVAVAKSIVSTQPGHAPDEIAVAEQHAYENNIDLFKRETTEFSVTAGITTPPASAPATPTPTPTPEAGKGVKKSAYPKEITIGKEKVRVTSKQDEDEAQRIFKLLKTQYGIDIDSTKVLQATLSKAPSVAKTVIAQQTWEIGELQALERGLVNFKSVIAVRRAPVLFNMSGANARLTSVGRVTKGVKAGQGSASETVMGEYFGTQEGVALYDPAKSNQYGKLADQSKTFESTVVHEAAHAYFQPYLDTYIGGMTPPYWKDQKTRACPLKEINTPACTPSPEMPITEYGETNAGEDLAEAVMFYYMERNTLQAQAPQRLRLVEKIVRDILAPTKGPSPTP
jgi:hypothetical protein